MNRLLLITFIAAVFTISFSAISFAVCNEGPPDTYTCDTSPPNPDPNGIQAVSPNNTTVNMLPGSGILGPNQSAIDCIETGSGNDDYTLNGATLENCDEAINAGTGNNNIDITNSSLSADNDPIEVDGLGTQTINIVGSSLTCDGNESVCNAIDGANGGVDDITVVQSILQGFNAPAILLNDGDDIVRLGTGADIRGLISCKGEFSDTGGFDTLIFNMAVPSDQLEQISLELADKDPAGDSIIINGLTYEWIRCDQIVNNIVGGFTTNVPTLSQWGLIATAGLLGIIGFIVIRRRQITI